MLRLHRARINGTRRGELVYLVEQEEVFVPVLR